VTTHNKHKQKIQNEIDMWRDMATLFDTMLVDVIDKLDKLNREVEAANRNVYGSKLEVATCKQHSTFLKAFLHKVKKSAITTPVNLIVVIYIFQHDVISMGCLLTLD
jgi:hypothetical protein